MLSLFLQCVIVFFSILHIKMIASDTVIVRAFGAFTQIWLQPVWVVTFLMTGNYFVVFLSFLYGGMWYNTFLDNMKIATRQGIHYANLRNSSLRLKKDFILSYFETLKDTFHSLVEDFNYLKDKWKNGQGD